jgi:hypothetical protein
LNRPAWFAANQWAFHRWVGFSWRVQRALGLKVPAREVVAAYSATRLADMVALRDSLLDLERLPTIRKGLDALGLRTMFEVPYRSVHLRKSPYTHPYQYPPHYLPGVPARTFYDPAEFEWARPLEDAFPVIQQELLQVLQDQAAGFKGYLSEANVRLAGWNTFNFFFYGRKSEENCTRCPRTTALLESLPRFERDHVMFSALNPGAHIPKHTGPMNGIIRAHLPLVTPPGAYIRVGPDQRTWEKGRLLVFDDSFEHEVWNHSDQVRIVLFINFWHPCFAAEEIPVLERFRQAYERSPLSRTHAENQAMPGKHDLAKVA